MIERSLECRLLGIYKGRPRDFRQQRRQLGRSQRLKVASRNIRLLHLIHDETAEALVEDGSSEGTAEHQNRHRLSCAFELVVHDRAPQEKDGLVRDLSKGDPWIKS